MNENQSWKKTQEVEINLLDLLMKLCKQWKQILVCAVVFACLLGGYRFIKGSGEAQTNGAAVSTEGIVLTKDEQKRVDGAVTLSDEIEANQKYMDESILMNIDPYHKDRAVLLYSIEDVSKRTKQRIVESYLSFIKDGGAIKELKEKAPDTWTMDDSYLAEVINAYQSNDSSTQIVLNETTANTLFYIEVTGKDDKMVTELARGLQEAVDAYQETVQKNAGEHTLTLLSKEQGVKTDSGLATTQHDKNYQLSNNLYNLKTLTDSFSEQQKAIYEETIATEDDSLQQEASQENAISRFSIKWIVLGFAGGIFVYCGIFACLYLLRDTVKSTGELKAHYTFPVFGSIILKKGTKGTGEDLSGREKDDYERQRAQLLNRIRLACQSKEITRICIASDFSFSEQEKNFVESASKQLKAWGIETVVGENVAGNVSVWDTLTEVGSVLMLYKLGTTTHQMIDEEMRFYTENLLNVIGAMTIEQ